MEDVQNRRGDYLFSIDKVGVKNLLHPLRIRSKEGKVVSTVGKFSLAVDLAKDLKGVNMSRLPQLLATLEEEEFIIEDINHDIGQILKLIRDRSDSNKAYLEVDFDYFLTKRAPVSNYPGIISYNCKFEASLEEEYNIILTVEVPVTTLCPCSKEISDYSAHNQRGYVKVSLEWKGELWIEEVIKLIEAEGSCEIYPVLKRIDEKHVTEKAYSNPRFVEDIVRNIGEKLSLEKRVEWFKVESRHQESIHTHDAYAILEKRLRD